MMTSIHHLAPAPKVFRKALQAAGRPIAAWLLVCAAWTVLWTVSSEALGYEFILRNGMLVRGRTAQLSSIAENPLAANPSERDAVRLVRFVDDGLRRTYFSDYQVESFREDTIPNMERIEVVQPRVASAGRRVVALTSILSVGQFDEFGRRRFSMLTPRGPIDVVQAVTEVTPVYTKLEGLSGENSVVWDMRIATSSLPRETLELILKQPIDRHGAPVRLALVRLLMQAERYQDAAIVLERAMAQHPELGEMDELASALRQSTATRLVQEIQLRQRAGQHRLALSLCEQFPVDQVAVETLQQVREVSSGYQTQLDQIQEIREQLKALREQVEDEALRETLDPICQEINDYLSVNNVARMADYLRLRTGGLTDPQQQLALAISGWLLGSGNGVNNLAVARSLVEVRDLVRQYLQTGPDEEAKRKQLIDLILEREGGTPPYIAQLLAAMLPPIPVPLEAVDATGLMQLEAPCSAPDQESIRYLVQLPPEYDPYRRYPVVVTLPPIGIGPQQQIEWWAGSLHEQMGIRMGQATRRGYVVISLQWWRDGQQEYEYSLREHAVVLDALRHASMRLSLDSDRVFLAGHGFGGDAAWDIGLAHPDLWAGVLAVEAVSHYDRKDAPLYVSQYWPNARYVPLYLVYGELDGNKIAQSAQDLDRYLRRIGYDVMVVEYRGRGREHFHDEIQRMFDWMDLHRREPYPKKVEFVTMRPWDNFFWGLEIGQLPQAATVLPFEWGFAESKRPAGGTFEAVSPNHLSVRCPSRDGLLWLSPGWVDFSEAIRISGLGRTQSVTVRPDVEVMLQDARTRGDRQHPFWARLTLPL